MGEIWTVGHSTRTWDDFLSLLTTHGIGAIADVRRYPQSRRYPHFNTDVLAGRLAEHHSGYRHESGLGGRRTADPDSINRGWRNAGFRGYADYMASTEFYDAFAALVGWASQQRTALMCAEAVPWRCHRSLLSDMLVSHGWTVRHILSAAAPGSHQLTPFARFEDGV